MVINEKTRMFIRQHQDDDVGRLALQGTKDAAVDLTMALQQIAGRQTARKKLPSWAAVEGILYPPHLNMEQCSSEQTARYKAKIVNGLTLKGKSAHGQCMNGKFVDLTGGFGVDFYWMSQGFKQRIYVEQNSELCAISSGNFRLLGHGASVVCSSAADVLSTLDHADVVFLDPARRNEHGGRTYGIADCTPNVLELLPQLLQKADHTIVKLSPMLDWRKAVADLQYVSEVHIVSVNNECKELLVVLEPKAEERTYTIHCVNIVENGHTQHFQYIHEPSPSSHPHSTHPSSLTAGHYLYEPNSSIMKAGCFEEVGQHYGASQLAPNSHLLLSSDEIGHFPGRRFQIVAISSMNKQDLKQQVLPLKRANIAVRNFPLTAEQLRKKLKMADGGDVYIFGTTTADNSHLLFICRKIS